AKAMGLTPGIALTAEQVARLTADIVWLETQTVTLPDGSTQTVLVPKVYVVARSGDLNGSGSLISADSIRLNIHNGTVKNGGTIGARQVVAINARDIENSGQLQADKIGLQADNAILFDGGTARAESLLDARGKNIKIASTTATTGDQRNGSTVLDRKAAVYVSGNQQGEGILNLQAENNLTLNAATVRNTAEQGISRLSAKNNVDLGTVRTEKHESYGELSDRNHRHVHQSAEVGTDIQTKGNVLLSAGKDLNIRQGALDSTDGTVGLAAGNNINISEGRQTLDMDVSVYNKSRGILSSTKTLDQFQRSHDEASNSDETTLTLSRIGSQNGNTTIIAGKRLDAEAARLSAGKDLTLQGSEVNLDADYVSSRRQSEQERKQSGVSVGVTYAPVKAAKAAYDNAKQNGQFSDSAVGKIMGTADAAARAGLAVSPVVIGAGSNHSQHRQDATVREAVGTEVQAGGNLNIIATEGNIRAQGAKLSAEGNAVLQAKRDVLLDVAESETVQDGNQKRKGWGVDTRQVGLLGTHNQNEDAGLRTTVVKGTELSVGGTTLVSAQTGNISVRGSSIVSQQDLVLDAAKNVSVLSAQNTQSNHNRKTGRGIGGAQISDTEQFFGYMKNQNSQSEDTVEQVRSQVGSLGGNTIVRAGETYTQQASDLLAARDIDVSAKRINVKTAHNTGRQTQSSKDTKIGTFASVSSPVLDAINAVDNALNSKADGRTKALQGLAAAGQGYQLADAVSKGAVLLKAEAGVGFKTARNQSEGEYSQSQGNLIQAGGNVRMSASEGDLRLQHTKATANGTLSLHAADNLIIESGINTQSRHGKNKNYGAEVGVGASVGAQTGAYIYAEAQFGKGEHNLQETTHSHSTLTGTNKPAWADVFKAVSARHGVPKPITAATKHQAAAKP
ncbi:hemagglutinin repeat-containing protein, partial [Conchiformibius steedae]